MLQQEKHKFILVISLAVIVGVFVGILGSLFHMGIEIIASSKSNWINDIWPFDNYVWVAYMLSSSIMIYLSIYMVRKFAPEAGGSGIQEIEGILEDKRQMRSFRVIIVKFFGGLLSLGGGMVMGREGPTVQMGGAVGNLISTYAKLENDDIKMLIAAGAGAGLAVAFNAPLAGILFVLEEMRRQFKYNYLSLQSVITASVSSVIVLHVMMGDFINIPMKTYEPPDVSELWIFIIFGVIFGVLGLAFNKAIVRFADFFSSLKNREFNVITLTLGASIGLLLYFWPNSVGDGFSVISASLSTDISLEILAALLVTRFVMTLLSYGTSAPGGIFAPMLAIGTLVGVFFGNVVNGMFESITIESGVFAVVGMSALFSATVRAPLTGIVLVVELTQNYELILPLIITSLIATFTVSAMGGQPIYTVLLERTLHIEKFGK
jgi:CIC family chloride channel protein